MLDYVIECERGPYVVKELKYDVSCEGGSID